MEHRNVMAEQFRWIAWEAWMEPKLVRYSMGRAEIHHREGEREHAKPRGRLRHGGQRGPIVRSPESRTPAPEGVLERAVQHRRTPFEEGLRGRPGSQRICCFLVVRLATTSFTALSTKAVETGSPRRRRAA